MNRIIISHKIIVQKVKYMFEMGHGQIVPNYYMNQHAKFENEGQF